MRRNNPFQPQPLDITPTPPPCRNEETFAPDCVQYNRRSASEANDQTKSVDVLQGCIEDDEYPLNEILSQLTKY